MSNEYSIVVVANENSAPQIVGGFVVGEHYSDSEAMNAAIEKAETFLDANYRFVNVGLVDSDESDKSKGLTAMLKSAWLNGHLTALGREWSK